LEETVKLEGVYSVLPTPFTATGDLDLESLKRCAGAACWIAPIYGLQARSWMPRRWPRWIACWLGRKDLAADERDERR
jgi:hypothetical protein